MFLYLRSPQFCLFLKNMNNMKFLCSLPFLLLFSQFLLFPPTCQKNLLFFCLVWLNKTVTHTHTYLNMVLMVSNTPFLGWQPSWTYCVNFYVKYFFLWPFSSSTYVVFPLSDNLEHSQISVNKVKKHLQQLDEQLDW